MVEKIYNNHKILRDRVAYDHINGVFSSISPKCQLVESKLHPKEILLEDENIKFGWMSKARLAVKLHLDLPDEAFTVRLINKKIHGNKLAFAGHNLRVHFTDRVRDPLNGISHQPHPKPIKVAETSDGLGCIYQFENIITGKSYIGQTIHPNVRMDQHVKDAFKKGGTKFQEALKLYGMINFAFRVIYDCPVEELDYHECRFIEAFDSCANGYNSTFGNHYKKYQASKKLI